jgi:hypothetical protein
MKNTNIVFLDIFFRLAIVLPVFRCTDSDYSFDIFKLFLKDKHISNVQTLMLVLSKLLVLK